jgi:P-type Ca2+ transporter type 2C
MNNIVDAHLIKLKELAGTFESNIEEGLSTNDAQQRLTHYGENTIDAGQKVSALKILLHNIHNIIVYLLLAASIVAFSMGDPMESFAIIVAILIAVLSGFITEYKAQKSVESLQKMVQIKTKVKRDGDIKELTASQLVVGDLVFLEEGDAIAADARIVKSKNFSCNESALTGESEAVEKDAVFNPEKETPLGDRKNMVYTGTAVTRGNAWVLVTATAMQTEIGKISKMISSEKKQATPLENQLNRLGKALVMFSGIVALLVTLFGIISGEEAIGMIKIGIMLAIAAVPEALPAVSTITLALGMKTMAKHQALVKSLPAVETLGSTTVICTDKTGTLTENQMTVKEVFLPEEPYIEITGQGYEPQGKFVQNQIELKEICAKLKSLLIAGVLSSNASLVQENKQYQIIGDPTEGGIIVLGKKASLDKKNLEKDGYERIGEIPFNSKEKFMATAYRTPSDGNLIYLKGAPDILIDKATFSSKEKQAWAKANDEFAEKGLRVLAIGEIPQYKGEGDEPSIRKAMKDGLQLLGLVGIMDPPRADVKKAIDEAQTAGVRVIMITGDHPKTARIIAEQIGMNNTAKVITGKEMDQMSDEELVKEIVTTSIFARVTPENKLQIVRALNIDKEVTAMTGDGVNDAPALNGADIGIAMGIRGTEVAKEASDMILMDDRFSTIVVAIKKGRIIFDNIEKFVYFLFSCNVVEIFVIFLAIAFRMPMPVLALQILWLNLVVDVFPAMSLAWEPGETDIMNRGPRDPQKSIVNLGFILKILGNGSLIGLGAFFVFAMSLHQLNLNRETAITMSFTTMAFGQLFHILNVRQKNKFGINLSLFNNPSLIIAWISSSLLQLMVIYVPFFNVVMGTVPIKAELWIWIALGAMVPTLVIQGLRLLIAYIFKLEVSECNMEN